MKRKTLLTLSSIMLFLLICSSTRAAITDNNRLWYSMDNANTNTSFIYDISGNNYNATNHNLTLGQAGVLNNAIYTTGTASYANITGYNPFSGVNDFSFSIWVKPTQLTQQNILYDTTGAGYITYELQQDSASQKIQFCLWKEGGTVVCMNNPTIPTLNQWYHIVITYNSTNRNITMYTNGVYTISATGSAELSTITSGTGRLGIGGSPTGTGLFTGYLDEFAFFNRTINNIEILTLYNSGLGYDPYINVTPNYYINTATCYQEQANESTPCGGLNTGHYNPNQSLIEVGSAGNYFYMNYSKPSGAFSGFNLWQIKYGRLSTTNITIPSNCSTTSTVQLRVFSHLGQDYQASDPECEDNIGMWNVIGAVDNHTGDIAGGASGVSPNLAYDGDYLTNVSVGSEGIYSGIYWSSQKANAGALYEEGVYWGLSDQMNLSLRDIYGVYINNFNVSIALTNGTTINLFTTTGKISVYATTGTIINITFSQPTYGTVTYANKVFGTDYQINAKYNAFNISILDENNQSLINWTTVNVTILGNSYTATNSTTNGYALFSNMPYGEYKVTINAFNYSQKIYFITASEGTKVDYTARLSLASISDVYNFYIKNVNKNNIQGAILTLDRFYDTSYQTVAQCQSNLIGLCQLTAINGQDYLITVSADGFTSVSSAYTMTPDINNSIIYLSPTGGNPYSFNYNGVNYFVTPSENLIMLNGTYLYNFSITTNPANGYALDYTFVQYGGTITNNTACSNGCTATQQLDLSAVSTSAYFDVSYGWKITGGLYTNLTYHYYAYNGSFYPSTLYGAIHGLGDDFNPIWKAIVATFIIIIMAVLGMSLTGVPIVGIMSAMATLWIFAGFGWIPAVWAGLVSVIAIGTFLFTSRG